MGVSSSVIIAVVLTGVSILMMIHSSQTSESNSNDYWYDVLNYYNDYTEIHNDNIDRFVMSRCQVSYKIVLDDNKEVPNIGTYSITYNDENGQKLGYVGLIKTCKKKNNREIMTYKTFSRDATLLARLSTELIAFERHGDEVEVMSIDTSADAPSIVRVNRLCKDMKPNQVIAVNEIMGHWTADHDFNTKILVHGERGLGKTYLGRLMKKKIEALDPSKSPLLFDDFNPSSIGVNVNTMILQKASEKNPVIIVINEIDRIYDKILSGQEPFDHRLQHSRNIQEFHNMLDNIGNQRHVIAIYTMEKNPHELIAKSGEYASFMRAGRVDFFLKLTSIDALKSH